MRAAGRIGLPAVAVLGIVNETGGPLWVHVATRAERPVCAGCGGRVAVKERPAVALVDLPAFRPLDVEDHVSMS